VLGFLARTWPLQTSGLTYHTRATIKKAAPRSHGANKDCLVIESSIFNQTPFQVALNPSITMKTTMQAKSHKLSSLLRDSTQDDATTHNQESADKGLAKPIGYFSD
jgi:hypothetical protein